LNVIKGLLKIGKLFRILPLHWNQDERKMESIKNRSWHSQWKFTMWILFSFYFLSSLQFLISVKQSESLLFLLLDSLSAAPHFSGLLLILAILEIDDVACQLFNCLDNFHRCIVQKGIKQLKM